MEGSEEILRLLKILVCDISAPLILIRHSYAMKFMCAVLSLFFSERTKEVATLDRVLVLYYGVKEAINHKAHL